MRSPCPEGKGKRHHQRRTILICNSGLRRPSPVELTADYL